MNESKGISARELRNVLFSVVVFAVLLVYGLRFIAAITGIILVFALTLLISLVLNPVVTWLERRKIPRSVSAVVLAISALGAVVGLIWLISPLIINQFQMFARELPGYIERLQTWIETRAPTLADRMPTNISQFLDRFGDVIGGVAGYAWNIVDVLTSLLVVLLGVIYILSSPEPLAKGLLSMFPRSKQDQVVTIFRRTSEQIRSWAIATLGGMLIIFLLTWLVLTIIGVQPAFLFAIIAGLLEVVPIIGPILAGLPPIFAALVTEPIKALYVIIAFVIIQQIESNVIIPLLQGTSLKLHPLSIIFVVLIMAGLFGIVGVFLAVPAAAVVKILFEELYLKRMDKNHEELQKKADQIIRKPEEE